MISSTSRKLKPIAARLAFPFTIFLTLIAFSPMAMASQVFDLTLNAGDTYVIRGVDPQSPPDIQFTQNAGCFTVQSPKADELVVLGTERGAGRIRVRVDGAETVYQITVNAVAVPGQPTVPGMSQQALSDDGRGPSPAPALSMAGVPSPYAASRSRTETIQVSPMAAVPASFSPNAFPLVTPNAQEVAPQYQRKAYATDPDAPLPAAPIPHGPNPYSAKRLPLDTITLLSGTSSVYDFPTPIARVSISDTKVAELQVINPYQLMLVAHLPGFATLVVWDGQGNYQEREIRTETQGHQQVLLDVTVAEVNRTKIETAGIDWSAAMTKLGLSIAGLPGAVAAPYSPVLGFIGSSASNLQSFAPPGGTAFPLPLSNNITYAIAGQNSNVSTNAFLEFLETNGLARVLAQPQLLANSGDEAKFLSGGEIPIVIAQALNTSIVFKQFGTSVIFLPTVVGSQDIDLVVKPEVSKPDPAQGVVLNGFAVPAFITRRAETEVRMRSKQTLIIAGLLLEDRVATVKKVPVLGDLPWVGGAFRNTSFAEEKTELMMTVTPQIVTPLPAGAVPDLPTDHGPRTLPEIKSTFGAASSSTSTVSR